MPGPGRTHLASKLVAAAMQPDTDCSSERQLIAACLRWFTGEWDEFMGSLRTTLPTTFRINGSGKFAEDLRTQLETNFLASFTEGPVRVGTCSAPWQDALAYSQAFKYHHARWIRCLDCHEARLTGMQLIGKHGWVNKLTP